MNDPFKEFGEEGFAALAAAFYRRIATDDIVGKFYSPERRAFAEGRLADFSIYRFGGSNRYLVEGEGHAHLQIHHPWSGITPAVRDRWLEMMRASMDEVGLTGPGRERLEDFFVDTSSALVNYDGVKCPGDYFSAKVKRFMARIEAES